MIRKMMAVAICVLVIFSSCIVVNAKGSGLDNSESIIQEVIQPYMDFIRSTSETLTISSGQANSTAIIRGYPGITTKVTITMCLERKTWWWWSTVESWTRTFDGHTGSLSRIYPVSSGIYRVRAVYTAYSGNASETVTAYSSEMISLLK